MINTNDFRTKTIFMEKKNPCADNYWPIALDIGYSSVKGYSPNSIFAFPAYAKLLDEDTAFSTDTLNPDDILYRDDETGELWTVGRNAQLLLNVRDTEDSQQELYGRDRYFSRMFTVLIRTGLALAISNNSAGDYNCKPVCIQTGLPPAYLNEDKRYLTEAIAGQHKFSVRTSRTKGFVAFNFKINENNVHVMSQPEGTLMSISTDDNGRMMKEAQKYFTSNVIIVDAGFGTFDLFEIKNRIISSKESFSQLGMRKVLERTCGAIRENYGIDIRPSAMQKLLETGTVSVSKRQDYRMTSTDEPFADILEEASVKTCQDAAEKILNIFPDISDYDYMILTGGTSEAWEKYFREYLGGISGLTILSGNENCPELDRIFANVRGYYMFLINSLRRNRT